MLTEVATGTVSTTVGGPADQLMTATDGKTYVLQIDFSAMASGDEVTLNALIKVVSAGSAKVVYTDTYFDAQDANDGVKLSAPVPGLYYVSFEVLQSTGSTRNFPWTVMSLDA